MMEIVFAFLAGLLIGAILVAESLQDGHERLEPVGRRTGHRVQQPGAVVIGLVRGGTDQRRPVHPAGGFREEFAEVHSRNGRGDAAKFPANLAGRLWLWIPCLVNCWAPEQVKEDDRLGAT